MWKNGPGNPLSTLDELLSGGQLTLFDDPALNKKIGLSRKKYVPEGHDL